MQASEQSLDGVFKNFLVNLFLNNQKLKKKIP